MYAAVRSGEVVYTRRCIPKRFAYLIDRTTGEKSSVEASPQGPTISLDLIRYIHVSAFVKKNPLLELAAIAAQESLV